MNNSGDVQQSFRKTVSLSRSLVLTEDTNISSVLILGKLHPISDGAADMASLRAKLLQEWAPSGTVNFWSLTNGAFLLQFNEEADLRKVMDGAPWSCDGDRLFLVRQVKPELNLVDQLVGVGFNMADLWAQFHDVPVDYFSAASLCALATSIGVPVVLPNLGAAPVDLLRARIRVDITTPLVRSLAVDLDDGSSRLVSVVYEQLPSLCRSCGVIGQPLDLCRLMKQPEAAPATAAVPHQHGELSGYAWNRLGSSTSASTQEQPPVRVNPKERQPVQRSGIATPGSFSKPEASSSAFTEHLAVMETQNQRLGFGSAAARSSQWNNFLGLISIAKKKGLVGEKDDTGGGGVNLQDMRGNLNNHTVPLTISAQQSVQVPFILQTS